MFLTSDCFKSHVIHICYHLWKSCFDIFHNPDKWRNDNVIITSTQCRFDVLMTLLLRYVSAGNMYCYHSNSQFHWGFSHKLVPLTARVFLWIQAASPIGRNTNCWPQVRQWHAGEQFGSLVCWQLFDVATEFHGDGRGVPQKIKTHQKFTLKCTDRN